MWGIVFERYRALALRLAASLSLGAADAQDAVQEAAAEILGRTARGMLTLDSEESRRNYFLRAVRNKAINRRTRARADGTLPVETVPSSDPTPIERLVESEARIAQTARVESVRRALAAIPVADRELMAQRFFLRRTLREIHEATGVAISTLHDRERSALEAIRARLIGGKGA